MLGNNFIALVVTFAAAMAWLRLMDYFAQRGWIDSRLSRKIIHIGTGPLFVACWLLFNDAPAARWLAALVPGAITVQFALVGLGLMQDPAAVQAMSRSGDRREILRGPLYYGIIFVVLTIAFWKDSPVGITALMLVCGGDGLADVLGRRYGRLKLPGKAQKSWVGSLSFLGGAWSFAMLMLGGFSAAGVLPGPTASYLLPVSVIAAAATLVEALSPPDMDNLTITVAAVALGLWLF
ncbi:MAG: diacylglycerol/polyprenol kinase family protein [Chloroflexota bacterium]